MTSAPALSASSCVIFPLVTINCNTVARRFTVASISSIGLYTLGAFKLPVNTAASLIVKSLALLPK